jgi:hypothetical protein
MAQVWTYKRELSSFGIYIFDPANLLNSLLLEDITTQSIYGISRIYDNTALFQAFYRCLYLSGLRIIGMNM